MEYQGGRDGGQNSEVVEEERHFEIAYFLGRPDKEAAGPGD